MAPYHPFEGLQHISKKNLKHFFRLEKKELAARKRILHHSTHGEPFPFFQ